MMHNMYRDFTEGMFIPDITITKREDNGHYTASSMGLSVTNVDQEVAINKLSAKLQEGILRGEIHPNTV